MNHRSRKDRKIGLRARGGIRTTFFDLVDELARLTEDDNLVVAAVKSIFKSHRVMAGGSLAPARLVVADRSRRAPAWRLQERL